ncbi:MAG: aminoglycoside phosphotransferase family protein [Promethearchaeota archaeon]
MKNKFTKAFFENIISKQTNKPTEIETLKIESYYDVPGLHWSNPGIRKVTIATTNDEIELIIKILHEKSKREVLIYRYLSQFQNFPISKVYYSEYDEDTNNYILIIEFGGSVGELPFKEPQIELCGKLLARIHSYFYDRIDTLPNIFFQKTYNYYQMRYQFKDNAILFLTSLKDTERKVLEKLLPNIDLLQSAIESLENSFFIIEPYTNWTLIHGAFHPPEIVLKKGESDVVPLGVDWEGSRVGHPAEDIVGITSQIVYWGEPHYYSLMINSYIEEMNKHHIDIDKQALEKEMIIENIILGIRGIPFLWRQYLRNKDDPKFTGWVNWFEEACPKITTVLLNEISEKKWTIL